MALSEHQADSARNMIRAYKQTLPAIAATLQLYLEAGRTLSQAEAELTAIYDQRLAGLQASETEKELALIIQEEAIAEAVAYFTNKDRPHPSHERH